ncbi:MAG: cysteine desulfurase [Clostridia bacterium]|nr:cysteine desulfurase [Clostridia bacterium]
MIFFDNASTTKCTDSSVEIVKKYLTEEYYNPSALYHNSLVIKQELESARATILKKLRGEGKIIFTGGGTESDNIALLGSKKTKGGRVIISANEHAAIYATAQELKARGFDLQICPVDEYGKVIDEEFEKLLTPSVTLVSIIHVNNETGAVNDIAKLCKLTKSKCPRALFHSDGVQATGKIEMNLRSMGVDMYSMSAHKIGAPKGVGALYIAKGVSVNPIVYGGGQEGGLRSSTENVSGILAFEQAVVERYQNLPETLKKLTEIKNYIKDNLSSIEGIKFLSGPESSPYILSFSTPRVRGEVMQHALERRGIMVGTGSACASNKASSRIAEALGLKGKYLDGVTRLSFFIYNTMEEAEVFVNEYLSVYKELERYGS